jgi:gluconate 2-dehydrogenase gamma chain
MAAGVTPRRAPTTLLHESPDTKGELPMADESPGAQQVGPDKLSQAVQPNVAELPDPARGPRAKSAPSRRTFLKVASAGVAGAVVGGAATYAATVELRPASPAPPSPVAHLPLRFFNDAQALVITAMAERMFPRDETGPGATDVHVLNCIDGRLVSAWGFGTKTYRQGPFLAPQDSGHGLQTPMTPRDIYKDALEALDMYCQRQFGMSFDQLQSSQQDDVLHALEHGTVDTFTTIGAAQFFAIFRQNVLEGLFADPLYGGNYNLLGWKWIGFPGDPMVYGDPYGKLIDKFNTPYTVEPQPLR